MKKKYFQIALAGMTLFSFCTQDKKEKDHDKMPANEVRGQRKEEILTSRDSVVLIDKSIWTTIDTSPEKYFRKAYNDYFRKDLKNAVSEIKKGSDYIKSQVKKDTGESKKALNAAIDELQKISSRMEKGKKVSEKELQLAFKKAQSGLAEYYYENSAHANKKNENKKSGQWLHSASESLQKSLNWTEEKTNAEYQKLVKEAEQLSEKLKRQDKKDNEELRMQLDSLGSKFNKAVKTP
jgi:hypothetical protein